MSDPTDRMGNDPLGTGDEQNLDSDDPIVEALFPDDEPEPRAKRQFTVRGVALVGARVATGVVGLAVAAVAVGGASLVPLPVLRSDPVSVEIVPVPTAQQLVCAGSLLRLSDDAGEEATVPSAIAGDPTLDFGASAGAVESVPVEQSDAGTGGTADAPIIVSAPPSDTGERSLISGAQYESVAAGEFVGIAATGCAPATAEAWFPAGSTEVGRTSLLTLANPTEVAATVDIRIYDERGAVQAPGTSGIIVPPNGQRVLSIAGFAPGLASPVVHVTSTGGQVVANLQETIVRGLDAGGADIAAPAAAPSTTLIVPGVVIANAAGTQQLLARGTDYADVVPVIRLFVPGEEQDVEATIAVFAEDGTTIASPIPFTLRAGVSTDVPLNGFEAPAADGNYTVVVTTSLPAVGSVRSTAVGQAANPDQVAPSDFAWFATAPLLTGEAAVTIADGPSPVLHLHNPTDAPANVSVGDQVVTVAPGASVAIPVVPGETLQLTGFDTIAASVTYAPGAALAGYPVLPPGAVSTPVTVYP